MNIVQAFQATLNPDPNVRQQAENFLNTLAQQPQVLPQVVEFALVRGGQNNALRKAALLCFGRTLGKMENITVAGQQILVQLSNLLTEMIKTETDPDMKGACASAISMFAECMVEAKAPWPQYFPTILEVMKMPSKVQQMIGMTALASSTEIEGYENLAVMAPQIISYCVSQLSSGDIPMIETVFDFLTSAIILFEQTEQNIQLVRGLVQPLCGTLMNLLKGGQFEPFDNCAMAFADMIEQSMELISGNEMNIANQFYQIALNIKRKESQQSAMEIVVNVIMQEPKLFKQNPQFVNAVVVTLFEWLSSIDDTTAQCILEDEETVEVENSQYAEEAYLRIVEAVGGSTIKDTLFKKAFEYLNSQHWQMRYAALIALDLTVEPGKFIFKNTLSDVFKTVIKFVNDPNPIVVHSLLCLLDELISHFPKMCRRRHFNEIIQITISAISSTVIIVQEKGCYVLNAILDMEDSKPKLMPFVPQLMQNLFTAMNSQSLKVVSVAISMICLISRTIGEEMGSFYQNLNGMVQAFLPRCTDEKTQEHKGKLIDLMGIYSTMNPSFFPQARQMVLQTFTDICNSQEIDSPMLPYILASISRYVEKLDQQFLPSIPTIVQLIAKRMQIPDQFNELSEISVFNPYVEEKCFMLNLLFTITTSTKAQFGSLVGNTLPFVMPLMNHTSNEIRQISAHLIPSLFEDLILMHKANGVQGPGIMQQVGQVYYSIIDHLCQLLNNEKYTDNIQSFLTCLKMILVLGGENTVDEGRLGNIFGAFDAVLAKILDGEGLDTSDVRIESSTFDTQELDDEEYERIQEAIDEEDDWLSLIMDLTSYICQSHKATFFNPFQFKFFPRIMTYFNQSKDFDKLSFAVGIIGCVIVDGGVHNYVNNIGQQYINFSQCPNIDVANNAIYFMGQFAKAQIPEFIPYIPQVLQAVGGMLQRKKSRAGAELKDQVLECVGYILLNFSNNIPNVEGLIAQWLAMFPANGHFEVILPLLCSFQEKQLLIPMMKIGNVSENIFRMVTYFASGLEYEGLQDENKVMIAKLIQLFNTLVSPQERNQIWSRLTVDQKGDLDSLFKQK